MITIRISRMDPQNNPAQSVIMSQKVLQTIDKMDRNELIKTMETHQLKYNYLDDVSQLKETVRQFIRQGKITERSFE